MVRQIDDSRMIGRLPSLGFYDFAAAQAGGADANPLGRTLHLCVDRAKVDVPAPLGHVVGVADVIPKLRPLAADFAYLRHGYSGSNSIGSVKLKFYRI